MTLHLVPASHSPRLTVVAGDARPVTRAPSDAEPPPFAELTRLVRRPWRLRADGVTLTIRPSTSRDLPTVAAMHRRCSAHTLLDRYRAGGRAPAPLAIERVLRLPLSFVACLPDGSVMATAVAAAAPARGESSAEVAILVEDAWQRIGIGRELMTHVAGAARVAGFTELIAYPGESVLAAQRLMIDVGRTRMVPDGAESYLRTALPEGATLGVGAVREKLVG